MWDPSWDPTETNGKYGGIPVGSPVGSPGIPCIPEPFAWPLDGIPQNRLFTRDPGTGRLTYIILPVDDQGACRGIPRLGSPIVGGLGGSRWEGGGLQQALPIFTGSCVGCPHNGLVGFGFDTQSGETPAVQM